MPETVVEKVSFSEFKIEKGILFTQSSTKIVCNSVLNVGACFTSCLTIRLFLTLDLWQLSVIFYMYVGMFDVF